MLLQQLLRPIHIDLRISLAHVNKIVVLRPIMAFQQFEDDFLTIVSVSLLLGFEYQLFMSKLLLLFRISLSFHAVRCAWATKGSSASTLVSSFRRILLF